MAYEVNLEDDEQLNPTQQQTNGQDQVPSSTGSGLLQPVSQSAASNQGSGQKFPTLQAYLGANADQAGNLADKVVGQVQGQSSNVKSLADQGVTNFQTQLQNETPQVPQTELNLIKQNAQNVLSLMPEQRQAIQNARSTTSFQTPSSALTNYLQPAQYAAEQAKASAEQAQSEKGRFDLLKQASSKPDYTRGQQNLDQALLQTDPTAKDKLSTLTSLYPSLSSYLSGKQTEGSDLYSQATQNLQNQAQNVGSTLFNVYGDVNAGAMDKENQFIQDQNRYYEAARQAFDPAHPSDAFYNIVTGKPAATGDGGFNPIYGVDPRKYIQAAQNPANQAQFVDTDTAEELRQLAELGGIQDHSFNYSLVGQQPQGVQFDKSGYVQDLYNQVGKYQQLMPTDQIDALNAQTTPFSLEDWGAGARADQQKLQAYLGLLKQDQSVRQKLGLDTSRYNDFNFNPDVLGLNLYDNANQAQAPSVHDQMLKAQALANKIKEDQTKGAYSFSQLKNLLGIGRDETVAPIALNASNLNIGATGVQPDGSVPIDNGTGVGYGGAPIGQQPLLNFDDPRRPNYRVI